MNDAELIEEARRRQKTRSHEAHRSYKYYMCQTEPLAHPQIWNREIGLDEKCETCGGELTVAHDGSFSLEIYENILIEELIRLVRRDQTLKVLGELKSQGRLLAGA